MDRELKQVIDYVVVGRKGTKVVKLSLKGLKKLLRKEIETGGKVKVADMIRGDKK